MSEAGRLLREVRERHGLSQRRLALRAGTSQDAISRIERGAESPTLERLRELLLVMGERPLLEAAPLEPTMDAADVAAARDLSPAERLRESASWNLVATKLELAGVAARRARHHPTPEENAPKRPLDLKRLFDVLAHHSVDCLVIGGVAVQVHGHRRTTKGLDILPAPRPGNRRRLAVILDELATHGEVHVLNEVKGAAPYDELRARALIVDLDGIEVAIVGLDDLIRMKRAAGRPEDIADVALLAALDGA